MPGCGSELPSPPSASEPSEASAPAHQTLQLPQLLRGGPRPPNTSVEASEMSDPDSRLSPADYSRSDGQLGVFETVLCKEEPVDFASDGDEPDPMDAADNAEDLSSFCDTLKAGEDLAPSRGNGTNLFGTVVVEGSPYVKSETPVKMCEGPDVMDVGRTSSVCESDCSADDVLPSHEGMFPECVVKEETDETYVPPVNPWQNFEDASGEDEEGERPGGSGSSTHGAGEGQRGRGRSSARSGRPCSPEVAELDPLGDGVDATDRPTSTGSGRRRKSISSRTCSLCRKSFPTPSLCHRHMRMHTGERPYKCDYCDKRFGESGNLRAHERTVHKRVKPHRCKLCGWEFARMNQLQEHMLTHSKEQSRQCTLCGFYFCRMKQLQSHCCQPSTRSGASAEGEVSLPVSDEDVDQSSQQLGYAEDTVSAGGGGLLLDAGAQLPLNCDQQFASRASLRIQKRKVLEPEKPCRCVLCGLQFADEEQLQAHTRTHSEAQSHQCVFCGVYFFRVKQLQSHRCRFSTGSRASSEGEDQDLGTEIAEQKGRSSVQLKHVNDGDVDVAKTVPADSKGAHRAASAPAESSAADLMGLPTPSTGSGTQRKPVSSRACSVCGKSFPIPSLFHRHMRTHTGERPFKCDHCDKRFGESGNLRAHERTVHKLMKPHRCKLCGRDFARVQHLRAHACTHSKQRHLCARCGASFLVRKHLDSHNCKHSIAVVASAEEKAQQVRSEVTVPESKPSLQPHCTEDEDDSIAETRPKYRCSVCSWALGSRQGLKNHLRSHKAAGRSK